MATLVLHGFNGFNQIGPDAQQAIDVALADLPQAVRRRAARRTVAALQRLALARVAVGAGSARWSTGGPVAAAITALPFVASRTVGAPDHSLLLEVLHLFAGPRISVMVRGKMCYLGPVQPEAAPVVVARHVTQPAEHLVPVVVARLVTQPDGHKRRRLEGEANVPAAAMAGTLESLLHRTIKLHGETKVIELLADMEPADPALAAAGDR